MSQSAFAGPLQFCRGAVPKKIQDMVADRFVVGGSCEVSHKPIDCDLLVLSQEALFSLGCGSFGKTVRRRSGPAVKKEAYVVEGDDLWEPDQVEAAVEQTKSDSRPDVSISFGFWYQVLRARSWKARIFVT